MSVPDLSRLRPPAGLAPTLVLAGCGGNLGAMPGNPALQLARDSAGISDIGAFLCTLSDGSIPATTPPGTATAASASPIQCQQAWQ